MGFRISGNKPAIFWMCSWCCMPQILNTCEHNREITNYLQFLLQDGIQKWIAHTAEGLPCLLFSSFTTKHILVGFIKSCQPLFSIIICFVPIARALLYYYSLHEYTIYFSDILFRLQHVIFCGFHIPLQKILRLLYGAAERFVTCDTHGREMGQWGHLKQNT